MTYMATCVPGAEGILAAECAELAGRGRVSQIKRGKAYVTLDGPTAPPLRPRCADNVYRLVAAFRVGPSRESLAAIQGEAAKADLGIPGAGAAKVLVSASRRGRHNYTRHEAAGHAMTGLCAAGRLSPGTPESHDVPVRLDVDGECCELSVQLTGPTDRFRAVGLARVPGALRPPVAHCLVRLGAPSLGGVFYDPFCGSGTIPMERASLGGGRIYASDVDPSALEAAKANLGGLAKVFAGDAAATSMKGGSVETVVTNPPWGRQVAVKDVGGLYMGFARELARILSPTGKAVVLTDLGDLLTGCAQAHGLRCVAVATLSLHGSHPSAYRIARDGGV